MNEQGPLEGFIAEKGFSIWDLRDILQAGQIEWREFDEDTLSCTTLARFLCLVRYSWPTRMLHFQVRKNFWAAEDRPALAAAIAEINRTHRYGRAVLEAEGCVAFEAFLSVAGGFHPLQVLHAIALFERFGHQADMMLPPERPHVPIVTPPSQESPQP